MKTFRLATINVRSFLNVLTRKNNVQDLVSIIKPLNLDLLAVQEIHNDHNWSNFCQNLSFKYSIFGGNYEKSHGNGIASRYPITFQLHQSTRSILQCRLGGDHPFVKDRLFGVTHLDHLNEDDRLKQIEYFKPHEENIDILMGDMNSLTRDDYSDDYYENVVVKKCEKPCFDLTNLITKQWNYQDVFKLVNPQAKDKQVATCENGTRIDYIYVNPCVNDLWKLTECSIINTKGVTDHKVVLAVFEQKDTDGTYGISDLVVDTIIFLPIL